MIKITEIIALFLVSLMLVWGCATEPAPPPEAPPEVFTPAKSQGGQIPAEIAIKASRTHEGSMTGAAAATTTGGQGQAMTTASGSALTVVLGPINAERLEKANQGVSDAGQSIREMISQKLTSNSEVTLYDAPKERFINDSPRPDLARKGVRFVIKGVVSSSTVSDDITVFLRAVNTATGKVAMVASARNTSIDQAVDDSAARLLKKLTGNEQ